MQLIKVKVQNPAPARQIKKVTIAANIQRLKNTIRHRSSIKARGN